MVSFFLNGELKFPSTELHMLVSELTHGQKCACLCFQFSQYLKNVSWSMYHFSSAIAASELIEDFLHTTHQKICRDVGKEFYLMSDK